MRIVNLCPARIIALTFDGVQPSIAAIDGQPCESFAPVDRTVPAGPGARFDVFLDLPAQADRQVRIIMRSWPLPGLPPEQPREVCTIRTAGAPVAKRNQRAELPENPALPKAIRLQDAKRVSIDLARNPDFLRGGKSSNPAWRINEMAHASLPKSPIFTVTRGAPVTIAFKNSDRFPQVMRIHGHAFRLLHPFDDGWDPYWRDSVIVPPGQTVRTAFIADNPGNWLIASGIAAHSASGLQHWFKVE